MTFTMLRACLSVSAWYAPEGPLAPEVIARQVTDQVVSGVLVVCAPVVVVNSTN